LYCILDDFGVLGELEVESAAPLSGVRR
jgi:hypothetical protein